MISMSMRGLLGTTALTVAFAAGTPALAQNQNQQGQQQQAQQQQMQDGQQQANAQNACRDLARMLDEDGGDVQLDLQRLQKLVDEGSDQRCVVVLDEVERLGGLQAFAENQEQYEQTVAEAEQLEIDVDARREVSATAQVSETVQLEREALVEGEIFVGVPQPEVAVRQGAPEVEVTDQAPEVNVRQQQPRILVRQPQQKITMQMQAPTITIEQPAPEIIITMPDPSVDVSQAEPQVDVVMADPQVEVQQADPEVAFDLQARMIDPDEADRIQQQVDAGETQPVQTRTEKTGDQPKVSFETATATVSQSRSGEPKVNIQRAEPVVEFEPSQPQLQFSQAGEPQIEVRQSGEPKVTFRSSDEQMDRAEAQGSDQQGQQQAQAMGDSETDMNADQAQSDVEEMADETEQAAESTAAAAGSAATATAEAVDDAASDTAQAVDEAASETAQEVEQTAEAGQDEMQEMLGRPEQSEALDLQAAPVMVSDIVGMDVQNMQGEDLGEVERVVQNAGETYIIVEHGGFLGIGDEEYALPLNRVMMGADAVVLEGLTEAELESMPEYDSSQESEMAGEDQIQIRRQPS